MPLVPACRCHSAVSGLRVLTAVPGEPERYHVPCRGRVVETPGHAEG